MKSKFDKWFRSQHGARPGGADTDELLARRVRDGQIAEGILARRAEWDARLQSALYAWQCSDEYKRGDAK